MTVLKNSNHNNLALNNEKSTTENEIESLPDSHNTSTTASLNDRCSNFIRSSWHMSFSPRKKSILNKLDCKRRSTCEKPSPAFVYSSPNNSPTKPDQQENTSLAPIITNQPCPFSAPVTFPPKMVPFGSNAPYPMCRICHGSQNLRESVETRLHLNTPLNDCLQRAESISASSTTSVSSSNQLGKLIAPCLCDGTLKYVHEVCLQQWISISRLQSCELCNFDFEMKTYTKPMHRWKCLPLTKVEYRRIFCSMAFHLFALVCVAWSLYVLIERAVYEISHQLLDWPFWTKLVVIAIGLSGGLIFSYIQCRLYVDLMARLMEYNRMFVVQVPSQESVKAAKKSRSEEQQSISIILPTLTLNILPSQDEQSVAVDMRETTTYL